jgi:TPP-dependent pyruvate/acetoin dehydrogenase alpha subunit
MTLHEIKSISFYKELLRLRRSEEIIADLYKEKEMRTPTHFGIGQEAIAVGVSLCLNISDVVYSHHRCHNHYLAKGGSLYKLIAELYGRVDGCSMGRGGSVHLTARECGFIGSSPILGQSTALAAGSALAFKMDSSPNIAVAYFGDAVMEEGVMYETLNYSATNALPVLFICENNLYSTESPLNVRQPQGTNLIERAKSFKVPGISIDGNDVFCVHDTVKIAVTEIRNGRGPFFIECMTYRWKEHVGPMFDWELDRGYRPKEELEFWMSKCPVLRCENYLLENNFATKLDLQNWKEEIELIIFDAAKKAKDSPWPNSNELFQNTY